MRIHITIALLLLAWGLCPGAAVWGQPAQAQRLIREGDSDELVLAVQGHPDRRERLSLFGREVWYYGESSFHFSLDTMTVQNWLNIEGNLLVAEDSGLPLPEAQAEAEPNPTPEPTPVDSGLAVESLMRQDLEPDEAFDPAALPDLEEPRGPAAPGPGRAGVGAGFEQGREADRYQTGLGALPSANTLGEDRRRERVLFEDGEAVYQESLVRRGGVTLQRSQDAQGQSVTGVRVLQGDSGAVEIFSDEAGRTAVGTQRVVGDTLSEHYQTQDGLTADRSVRRTGEREVEEFRRSDGLVVRREAADYSGSRLEQYDATLPDGTALETRATGQDFGGGEFRRYETLREGEDGGRDREVLQGMSQSTGGNTRSHQYIDPATGAMVIGSERGSDSDGLETYITPEGEMVTRSSHRVGGRVYTNYIDEKGELRQEITTYDSDEDED